jgi:hypothetical protein
MTAAVDPFVGFAGSPLAPANDAVAVSKSDSVNFATMARALYVGGLGDVALVTAAGNVVVFTAVPAGTTIHMRCSRVNSTSTTATNIVALI